MKPKLYRTLALQPVIYIAALALVAISISGCGITEDSPVYDENISPFVEQLRDPDPQQYVLRQRMPLLIPVLPRFLC